MMTSFGLGRLFLVKIDEEKRTVMEDGSTQDKKPRKIVSFEKGGIIWSSWNFVEAALLVTLGVLSIAFSGKEEMMNFILPVLGSFFIISGTLRILTNFIPIFSARGAEASIKAKIRSAMSYGFVIAGSLELAFGIALVAAYLGGNANALDVSTFLIQFGVDFIGIVFIVAGVSLLVFAVAFLITRLYKLYMPIIEIVFGISLATIGIILIVLFANNRQLVEQIILIITGIVLILAGLGLLVTTIQTIQEVKAEKALEGTDTDVSDDVIDVDSHDDSTK